MKPIVMMTAVEPLARRVRAAVEMNNIQSHGRGSGNRSRRRMGLLTGDPTESGMGMGCAQLAAFLRTRPDR